MITLPGRCPVCGDRVWVKYRVTQVQEVVEQEHHTVITTTANRFECIEPEYPVHGSCKDAFRDLKRLKGGVYGVSTKRYDDTHLAPED